MENDERRILDQIRLLGLQASRGKKDNLMTLIQVYLEVVKRCPYLANAPQKEQMELIRILKEYGIV